MVSGEGGGWRSVVVMQEPGDGVGRRAYPSRPRPLDTGLWTLAVYKDAYTYNLYLD